MGILARRRAEKMTEYLRNNPESTDSEINNEMARIVFQEEVGQDSFKT